MCHAVRPRFPLETLSPLETTDIPIKIPPPSPSLHSLHHYSALENLKAAGGEATRDDWMSWDLHEDGRAPVALDEREQALDLLEEEKYIKSLNALQASHLRVEITSRGRTALMRPDVLLTSGLFDRGQTTNFEQRVGIQAQTFNKNN